MALETKSKQSEQRSELFSVPLQNSGDLCLSSCGAPSVLRPLKWRPLWRHSLQGLLHPNIWRSRAGHSEESSEGLRWQNRIKPLFTEETPLWPVEPGTRERGRGTPVIDWGGRDYITACLFSKDFINQGLTLRILFLQSYCGQRKWLAM